MRHITRKRLLSFFLAMALILTFSPISAAATYAPEEHEIDEDVAVTIAMLFVWANIGESEWIERQPLTILSRCTTTAMKCVHIVLT
jgi:hypothetical protein